VNRAGGVALGIVVGALAAVLGSRLRDLDPAERARERVLDDRVRKLEQAARSETPRAPGVSAEVQAREHRALHAAAIAKHVRQPVDGEWSASMVKVLTREIESEAAEGHFKLVRVDCRTTSCIAALEWPSRNDGVTANAVLVRSMLDVPCSREILLDDEAPQKERFVATMVFECEREQPVRDE
jgi:hypothetical protein